MIKYKGLTLVEIVVVVAIVGALLALTLIYINPLAQVEKINDATRKRDLQQIKTALDTYYNDHGCYPTNLPFGSSWSENGAVYMREVPQDPDCEVGDPSRCYVYKYSGTCPQWNVLFAKLTKDPVVGACQLKSPTCVPSDFSSSSWSCVASGNTDCTHLTSSALSSGSDSDGSQGPGPVNTPTPTPTITCVRSYSCTGQPAHCNIVTEGTGQYCDPSYYDNRPCNNVCL